MVADDIIQDCLTHPWINDHGISTGGKREGPSGVVIVGGIRNKSMEHIPVATFITDIERAFINSGKVRTVSSASEIVVKCAIRPRKGSSPIKANSLLSKLLNGWDANSVPIIFDDW